MKRLSNLILDDTHPYPSSDSITDSTDIRKVMEKYLQDVSSEESSVDSFLSLNYGKLDNLVNELEAEPAMPISNGTGTDGDLKTLISSDTDDCRSSLCLHSEYAD